jgi:hypothetical protein
MSLSGCSLSRPILLVNCTKIVCLSIWGTFYFSIYLSSVHSVSETLYGAKSWGQMWISFLHTSILYLLISSVLVLSVKSETKNPATPYVATLPSLSLLCESVMNSVGETRIPTKIFKVRFREENNQTTLRLFSFFSAVVRQRQPCHSNTESWRKKWGVCIWE